MIEYYSKNIVVPGHEKREEKDRQTRKYLSQCGTNIQKLRRSGNDSTRRIQNVYGRGR